MTKIFLCATAIALAAAGTNETPRYIRNMSNVYLNDTRHVSKESNGSDSIRDAASIRATSDETRLNTAVNHAQLYLVAHQNADGSWGDKNNASIDTAVAVEALMCARTEWRNDRAREATVVYPNPEIMIGVLGASQPVMGQFGRLRDLARMCRLANAAIVRDATGKEFDWRHEIVRKIVGAQNDQGGWDGSTNTEGEDAIVATADAVIALEEVRLDMKEHGPADR